MRAAQPTIQDVARQAEVSTATVSRTLSYPESVSEATRRRVLAAVELTGYSVNQMARNLRKRTTGAIVVLVPNIGNPFFSRILAGIEAAAARSGYTVLICDTRPTGGGRPQLAGQVRPDRADGLISLDGALPDDIDGPQRNGPPLIYACEWKEGSPLPSIRFDNEGGAELAVDHLVSLGHREIGHVLGPSQNVLSTTRRNGFLRAMRRHGLTVRDEWMIGGDFMLGSGVTAARTWLELAERPSAMFIANDEMACGFVSELHRHGVETPRDMSVVSFDDIDIAEQFIPGLTTVHQPREGLGEAAFEALLPLMQKGGEAAPSQQVLPATLVIRESARKRDMV
ncbi:MAG: LacI family DNA-binding transcriptional regulator [Mesorhizobium sp.]